MNRTERKIAKRAVDAAWSATSKLESQINRRDDLPEAYTQIMQESYDALRELKYAAWRGSRSLHVPGEQPTVYERFLLLRGRWRLLWGFCPACNSDAPGVYNCQVCGGYRTPGDGRVSRHIGRLIWWRRFYTRLRMPNYGGGDSQ